MEPSTCPSVTPPMVTSDRRPSDDSYYFDSYFSKTYVPLSNLPTPPLSSHSDASMRLDVPEFTLDGGFDPDLLGPSIHLRNLVPSSVSLLDPSTQIVHSILVSAELPLTTIALAVSILDSLNSRFALSWRRSCPLKTSEGFEPQILHIDSIRPEVIILAALVISVKFLDDQQSSTRLYSNSWGSERWTCEQINATQQCIMENLRYRILPLWTEELISDALEDMETAGRYANGLARGVEPLKKEIDLKALFSGNAIWSSENQLTPAETPILENIGITKDVISETRHAFGLNDVTNSQTVVFSRLMTIESFPLYTEPTMCP